MSDKPTTGTEWTVRTVQELGLDTAIAQTHNAALAAERESMVAHARDEVWEEVKQLREQLAAERKATARYRELWHGSDHGKREKTLVDALKRCVSRLTPCHEEGAVYKQAIDALAKVEDQPVQLPMINDDPVVELK